MSTRRKVPAKLATPVVRSGAHISTRSTIDESRTSVSVASTLPSSQVETIEISSDEDSDEDVYDTDGPEDPIKSKGELDATRQEENPAQVNGENASHDGVAEEPDGEPTSPSFGELLRDNEVIDIPSLLQKMSMTNNSVAKSSRPVLTAPTHQSLTTVLSQALRTDDSDLLESCFQITDVHTIQNTINQINSSLAGVLLAKLAARLHRRPGRAGLLISWIQWTLVAHGGALASQRKVIGELNSLQKVLSERARGLNSLLALKGKLDLLEGQMQLRKKMKRGQGEDDGNDADVVWVEGKTDDAIHRMGSHSKQLGDDSDERDDNDVVPEANGFVGDSEDGEDRSDIGSGDDSEEVEELVDEDEVDHDDVDDSAGDEESDDETAAPPSKAQKVSRSSRPRKHYGPGAK